MQFLVEEASGLELTTYARGFHCIMIAPSIDAVPERRNKSFRHDCAGAQLGPNFLLITEWRPQHTQRA
jgi:hypothetical protein